MLNHIWLALIIIGILTAAGRDIYDAANNSYGNDVPWSIEFENVTGIRAGERLESNLTLRTAEISKHFPGLDNVEDLPLTATLIGTADGEARMLISLNEHVPAQLTTIAEAQGHDGSFGGSLKIRNGAASFIAEPVSFVFLKRITNAAFAAAELAVSIAIGLIGIMALWLGIMKVAEASGLVNKLASAVKPLTAKLFPDVPHDHPAIAAMIMNIAANMLGLGNAATPFGLKAMEELNSINPKAGVATNAMVTFLALNTSCITLIPATAIAIRAASGSNDPAAIIGTTFLASLTATIVGVTVAKTLQRLRVFKVPQGEEA
jgi:spore maturation protein A